jgi:hypothetical protein
VTSADGPDRLRRRRLRSQLLSGPPADSAQTAVGHLLAVQAQDPRGFRLAIRSRTRGLVAGDVDAALDVGRLVVTTLNRGTLHLVRAEDYWFLHRLTAHRVLPGVERRLRQLGVDRDDEERGVAVIVGALRSEGPLARHQLRERLDDEGVPTAGQALVYLLTAASLRGHIVRGPMSGGHQAFVSVDRWLGPAPTPPSHAEDLDRLVRRYLAGHAPARPEDLAAWAGITLGDSRAAFADLAGELRQNDDGAVLGAGRSGVPAAGRPRLLGPFDPVLHGWASREPFVGEHRSVVTTNGIFRAVCLVGGRVVGTWTLPSRGLVIELLEDIDEADRRALVSDAADVTRFVGHDGGPVTFAGG